MSKIKTIKTRFHIYKEYRDLKYTLIYNLIKTNN